MGERLLGVRDHRAGSTKNEQCKRAEAGACSSASSGGGSACSELDASTWPGDLQEAQHTVGSFA